MRSSFQEFYPPNEDEQRRFIVEGTVVLDTNIMLSLYRFSADQREAVLEVLRKIGKRLWIPYQVGLEYQRNRMPTIQQQAGKFQTLNDLLRLADADELGDRLQGLKLDESISSTVLPHLEKAATSLRDAAEEYSAFAREIRDQHIVDPDIAATADPVRATLDELFEGRVGPKPDEETKTRRLKEAADRARLQVPPGYKDEGKDTPERQAGDYFLWAEMLEYAAESEGGTPFLLVTNDVKEDWYQRSGKVKIGPRPELVREFAGYNSAGYHQITLDELLTLANKHLSSRVDANTIAKAAAFSEEMSRRSWRMASPEGQFRQMVVEAVALGMTPEQAVEWASEWAEGQGMDGDWEVVSSLNELRRLYRAREGRERVMHTESVDEPTSAQARQAIAWAHDFDRGRFVDDYDRAHSAFESESEAIRRFLYDPELGSQGETPRRAAKPTHRTRRRFEGWEPGATPPKNSDD